MATLLKVLNNLADIKSAGGVALRLRTQGATPAPRLKKGGTNCGIKIGEINISLILLDYSS